MSVCLNPLRRTLGSAGCKRTCNAPTTAALSSNFVAAPTFSALDRHHVISPIRHFAAAAKKAKSAKSDGVNGDQNGLSYQARKDATKQKRRDTYNRHQERLKRLETRRDNSPKDVKKNLFRSWWDKETMYHGVLCRKAKRENKPWRIRVVATVERLPVVTPDVEPWEREYIDLRDYLWTYGKEYPEECGFMYAPDKPEDHIVPTDEELLASLPFTPAPRETEADATGFFKTRDRELKTRVYLALRTASEGNKSGPRWTFPSAIAKPDETMLETAQRAVSEAVGTDLVLWCPSNAPMFVNFREFSNNLSEEFRENYFGEKIFYYRVQYDHGDVDEGAVKANEDYAWFTREEMTARVEGERGKHQAKFYHYML